MKDYSLESISEKDALIEILKKRDEILEQFTKAYIAETGILPSKLELVNEVTEEDGNVVNIFYFREKKDESI